MGLFKDAENTVAYGKIGLMGEAGSGKTYTATLIAIGLIKYLRAQGIAGADKPAYLLDTEQGSSWIAPLFKESGIPLRVATTRAFKDLVPSLQEAEKNGSILIIDSVTHFWAELQATYMAEKRRTKLEFQDWAVLKQQWNRFADQYVTSHLHCILCGRLGHEYETTTDDRGRKQIEKSGVKMAAEKGLGYEPNMLIWMERDMDLASKSTSRTATILKDRSRKLDGKTFSNPTFATFLPHIQAMALGGNHAPLDTSRTSAGTLPDPDRPDSGDMRGIRRQIAVDEIQALMVEHYPSTSAADKAAKGKLLVDFFRTSSWTEVEKLMPLADLQANFDAMHRKLKGVASRYGVQDADASTAPVDELPSETHVAQVANPEPAPEDGIVLDFKSEMQSAGSLKEVDTVWKRYSKAASDQGVKTQLEGIRNARAAQLTPAAA